MTRNIHSGLTYNCKVPSEAIDMDIFTREILIDQSNDILLLTVLFVLSMLCLIFLVGVKHLSF